MFGPNIQLTFWAGWTTIISFTFTNIRSNTLSMVTSLWANRHAVGSVWSKGITFTTNWYRTPSCDKLQFKIIVQSALLLSKLNFRPYEPQFLGLFWFELYISYILEEFSNTKSVYGLEMVAFLLLELELHI